METEQDILELVTEQGALESWFYRGDAGEIWQTTDSLLSDGSNILDVLATGDDYIWTTGSVYSYNFWTSGDFSDLEDTAYALAKDYGLNVEQD